MATQLEKAEAFAALHAGEPFLIPNPRDAGSARVLEALGFKALATTSSGFALTLGRLDGGATLDEVVAHVRALTAASSLPVSVDLENGYGQPRRARGIASDRRLAQLSSTMRSASAECRRRPSARPTAIASARRSPTSTHRRSARVTAV